MEVLLMRDKAWRRYKNYTKAKRKREIDLATGWWDIDAFNNPFCSYYEYDRQYGMYSNLHQYSKNKIHCSCPKCSVKTRNKGHRRKRKNYAPAINYRRMDKRRQMAMDYDEQTFQS